MRTRAALHAAALVAITAIAAPSQDRFVVAGWTTSTPQPLLEMDATGTSFTTVLTFPWNFGVHEIRMADDNRSYRIFGRDTQLGPQAILDATGGVLTTVASGGPLFLAFGGVRNSDGDWYVLNRTPLSDLTILRLRGNTLTQLSTAGKITPIALTRDEATGQLIVRGTIIGGASGYFRIDPNTGTVTSLAARAANTTATGSVELLYDPATGGVIDGQRINLAAQVMLVDPTFGEVPFGAALQTHVPIGMARSGPRRHPVAYYLLTHQTAGNPHVFQYQGDGSITVTSSFPTPIFPAAFARIGARHLAWFVNRAPNDRRLRVSFPGEGGKAYTVAFSLTGMRPGIGLPDGRTIPLVVDALTVASLAGGIPNVLQNTVGFLNAQGQAVVTVDTSRFGSALKGRKAWAVAVLLDPASPTGVAYITKPTLLEINE